MKLQDKVALVTGSASGMGAAQAIEMAKEGAKVFLTDRNEAGLIETKKKIDYLHEKNAFKLRAMPIFEYKIAA